MYIYLPIILLICSSYLVALAPPSLMEVAAELCEETFYAKPPQDEDEEDFFSADEDFRDAGSHTSPTKEAAQKNPGKNQTTPQDDQKRDTEEHLDHHDETLFTEVTDQESFYKKSVLYFIGSTSEEDLEARMEQYCQRFRIPTNFKSLNYHWFNGRPVVPFKDIQEAWLKKPGTQIPEVIANNEKHTRMIEAVCHLISSKTTIPTDRETVQNKELYDEVLREIEAAEQRKEDLGEIYLHKFLKIQTEEEFQSFLAECQERFHITKIYLNELVLGNQSDDHLDDVVSAAHQKWEENFNVTIPKFIGAKQTQSLLTLLMLGELSQRSFDQEALQKQLKATTSKPIFNKLPNISQLSTIEINILKQAELIIPIMNTKTHQETDSWNEEKLCFITLAQRNHLLGLGINQHLVSQLYSKSFFFFLREMAQKSPSDDSPIAKRNEFIAELEQFLVTIYERGEDAYDAERLNPTLVMIPFRALPKFQNYTEVTSQFRRKILRLRRRFSDENNEGKEFLSPDEIQAFWEKALTEQTGLCYAGTIGAVLLNLEGVYSWSRITSPEEALLSLSSLYHRHIVARIAGLIVRALDMEGNSESHITARVQKALNQKTLTVFSEVGQIKGDPYAPSSTYYTDEDIQNQFEILWNPLDFGIFCLNLFQDKSVFNMFPSLYQHSEVSDDVFLSVQLNAIDMSCFLQYIGQAAIVFRSPEEQTYDIWKHNLSKHNFEKLKTSSSEHYWTQAFDESQSCLEYALKHAEDHEFQELEPILHPIIQKLSRDDTEKLLLHALGSSNFFILKRITSIIGEDRFTRFLKRNMMECLLRTTRNGAELNFHMLVDFIQKDARKNGNLKVQLCSRADCVERIFVSCLPQNNVGLNMFSILLEAEIIPRPDPKRCYVGNESFLTKIVKSVPDQEIAIKFLEYCLRDLQLRPDMGDSDEHRFYTYFHWACQLGKLEIVKFCVETCQLSVDYSCSENFIVKKLTPKVISPVLNVAADHGQAEVVRYLLSKKARYTQTNPRQPNQTALHLACKKGHLNVIQAFLEHDRQGVVKSCYSLGPLRPINLAAERGHFRIIKELCQAAGTQKTKLMRAQDNDSEYQFTMLHHACLHGRTNMVEFLVENGAKVSVKDNNLCSAATLAARKGHLEIVKHLTKKDEGWARVEPAAVVFACEHGHIEVVKWFFNEYKFHEKQNLFSPWRGEVLKAAIENGRLEVVQFLVGELGLEDETFYVGKHNDHAASCIEAACYYGQADLVRWLIPHWVKRNGYTIMDVDKYITVAMKNEAVKVVEYFVTEFGAPLTNTRVRFLNNHGCKKALKEARKVMLIEDFIKNHNPFLSLHRKKQLQEFMRENDIRPFVPLLAHWNDYFGKEVHQIRPALNVLDTVKSIFRPRESFLLGKLGIYMEAYASIKRCA